MKFTILFLLCLAVISEIPFSDAAKILFFFSGGTYSHKVSIWPFVAGMADRGHNITFFSSFNKRPFEHSQIRDIAPQLMADSMAKQFQNIDRLSERLRNEETRVWSNYHADELRVCESIFAGAKSDPEMSKIFYNETFDLIINNVIFGDCGLVLAHHLMQTGGTKLILFNSGTLLPWFHDLFGFPSESSWIPEGGDNRHLFPMNFFNRMWNYFVPILWHLRREWEIFSPLEKMMRGVYKLDNNNYPSLREVERNASLIFVASHHGTDFPRSLPPFVISVGGMQCWQERKPFEGEFKEFLNNATNGAILIAFGSTIDLSRMPPYFKTIFFDTIRKFPEIQFIWRWDGSLPKNHPKNLKVANWLPQYDILGHPNVKAFVSHAGLNSLTEATCQGVPVVLLPLFADQDYNGHRVEAYEIGLRLEAATLSSNIMENAVREVLTNEKYTKNMKRMSAVAKDRPLSPVETAVYWSEFVLRHEDTSSLKPLNKLYWFQRRMWDVFFMLAFLAADLMLILYACIRFSFKIRKNGGNKTAGDIINNNTRGRRKKIK